MRSRPAVTVRHRPPRPHPGEAVHFEIEVTGRTETPIDVVKASLSCVERRGAAPMEYELTHLEEQSRWGPLQLQRDERRQFHFDVVLPAGLPPSWQSDASSVRYVLDVQIDIPWWPGRSETFEVFVDLPRRAADHGPRSASSSPQGPRGTELVVEAALADRAVPQGGTVRGAIALGNSEYHQVKQLELALVLVDGNRQAEPSAARELLRTAPTLLCEGPPQAGANYSFAEALPVNAPLGFEGGLGRVQWCLEARAVRAALVGGDVRVLVPLDVHLPESVSERETGPTRTGRVALLGRERRERNWSEVARLTGLASDPERELMIGEFGAVDLVVSLERREQKLAMVAELNWPRLGAELRVVERRWTDRFKASPLLGDVDFDQRFTARARTLAQRDLFLDRRVRRALLAFEQVSVEDEGATLASAGNGDQVQNLESFVTAACDAARALGVGVQSLPVPEGLEPLREAWRTYAATVSGQFTPGDFSIRLARYRDAAVELLTRFDAEGNPSGTVARVLLDRRLVEPVRPEALPEDAQRVLASISKEIPGVKVGGDAVEAVVEFPLAEPSRAEPTWRALQRLAQALAPAVLTPE